MALPRADGVSPGTGRCGSCGAAAGSECAALGTAACPIMPYMPRTGPRLREHMAAHATLPNHACMRRQQEATGGAGVEEQAPGGGAVGGSETQ